MLWLHLSLQKMAEYTINYKIVKTGSVSGKQDTDWVMSERQTNSGTAQKERKRYGGVFCVEHSIKFCIVL